MSHPLDTIAAIITPAGVGGVSVIRISGSAARKVGARVVSGVDVERAPANSVHFGRVAVTDGQVLDEVLVTVFSAPHSYTGEDVVEINCHGNPIISQIILQTIVSEGARLAEPGEFTRRAFVNGRMDLTQAEAVADVISANSEAAIRLSQRQLKGELGTRIRAIMDELVGVCGLIELDLDFAEEHIDISGDYHVTSRLTSLKSSIESLLKSYQRGRLYAHGISVAIVGATNVGKSSLLNVFAGEDRAIVSPIPGTTRDTINAAIQHRGVRLEFWDTAGVRATVDGIEMIGIERAMLRAGMADVVLRVLDASANTGSETDPFMEVGRALPEATIVVLNKCDLPKHPSVITLGERNPGWVEVSAKTGEGIERLLDVIVDRVLGTTPNLEEGGAAITNQRHFDCLRRTDAAIAAAIDGMNRQEPAICALEVRQAIDSLGEIIGTVTPEEVLNAIFANFCIGK